MEVDADAYKGQATGRGHIAPKGQFSLSHDEGTRSDKPKSSGHQPGNFQHHDALQMGRGHRAEHAKHVPAFVDPFSSAARCAKDHMINEGVAQGEHRHGRGRRHLHSEDHMIDEGTAEVEKSAISGRKHAIPVDHLFTEVLAPWTAADQQAIVEPEEMRAAIREWLTHGDFDMKIADEKKWKEVEIFPKGTHWLCSTINNHAETISREGSTAQQIAEKMSQMPISQLRFFGVRFRRQDELKSPPMSTRGLRNPSLVSPGVCDALSQMRISGENATAPFNGASAQGRQYVSSGHDHFDQMDPEEDTDSRTYGHPRTSTYVDGFDRDVGHEGSHNPNGSHVKNGTVFGTSTPSEDGRYSERDQDGLARKVDHARETADSENHFDKAVSESGTSRTGNSVHDREAKQEGRDTTQYMRTGSYMRPASYLAW